MSFTKVTRALTSSALSMTKKLHSKLTPVVRGLPTTGSFAHLSVELVTVIIGHFEGDGRTLRKCALVHSSWTSIARSHLRVNVWSAQDTHCIGNLLKSKRQTLSHIGGITLNGQNPIERTTGRFRPLLKNLHAKGAAITSAKLVRDTGLVELLWEFFPDITDLTVVCYQPEQFATFMSLLWKFTKLRVLNVELGTFSLMRLSSALSGLKDIHQKPPPVRTLNITGWDNMMVKWLGTYLKDTLILLNVAALDEHLKCNPQAVQYLLTSNATTLRHVQLSFSCERRSIPSSP